MIGAIERKGKVVARYIERVNLKTVQRFVSEAVSHKVSLVATDDLLAYRSLPKNSPTAPSITAPVSTWSVRSTPTPSKAFGR